MNKASIISIGNEILSGQTVDTNAAYLGGRLLALGVPAVSFYTVGDDEGAVVQALGRASAEADVVLVTGGLGPTDDDLTRQALARFLHVELEFHQELLDRLTDLYRARNRAMLERNRIQAHIPRGATALPNDIGTASGILVETDGRIVAAMPGVPAEMRQMFEQAVVPRIVTVAAGQAVCVRKLKCFGAGESNIAEMLGDLMRRGRNPLINCTARFGVITLHIIATAETSAAAREMAEQDERTLRQTLGRIIYGQGDQTLAEVVGAELARQNKTLALAESCTGGTLAKLITDISGSSKYFTHGWITYSNQAKTQMLGVPAELISKHGAVSAEVAQAMAERARRQAGADFAIAITGIAGPTGASEQKPVGLVYISVVGAGACSTERCTFSHDRDFNRLRAAHTALNMLRIQLGN